MSMKTGVAYGDEIKSKVFGTAITTTDATFASEDPTSIRDERALRDALAEILGVFRADFVEFFA